MKIIVTPEQLKRYIKNKVEAKYITCRNCRKKFTQTIYKGKKSDPICPYCGTVN